MDFFLKVDFIGFFRELYVRKVREFFSDDFYDKKIDFTIKTSIFYERGAGTWNLEWDALEASRTRTWTRTRTWERPQDPMRGPNPERHAGAQPRMRGPNPERQEQQLCRSHCSELRPLFWIVLNCSETSTQNLNVNVNVNTCFFSEHFSDFFWGFPGFKNRFSRKKRFSLLYIKNYQFYSILGFYTAKTIIFIRFWSILAGLGSPKLSFFSFGHFFKKS